MMRRFTGVILLAGCLLVASGCSLPGQAFPGGPSPWLPGGAPDSIYAPDSSTMPSPEAATGPSAAEAAFMPGLSETDPLVHSASGGESRVYEGFRYNARCIFRPLPSC